MMSTRTPWMSISGQIPVAATRPDCQSMSAMRDSEIIGRPLPYDDEDAIRAALVRANPVFGRLDAVDAPSCREGSGPRAGGQPLGGAGFTLPITDYYRVDPISRASEVMAECSRVRASAAEPRLAAE